MNETLMRAVVELVVFFERVPDDQMHPDAAVDRLEEIAAVLHALAPDDRSAFVSYVSSLAESSADDERRRALLGLPDALGIGQAFDGTVRPEWFDPRPTRAMIDRKLVVILSAKGIDQAARQNEALRQNRMAGRWEVPSIAQAARAEHVLRAAGATRITVRVVEP